MTALPKGRPACKYETSAAFSRRRMQYNIGDAPLEEPREEPKKALDPHEEKKLSGDMRELYDRLLPSKESEWRRAKLIEKLGNILRKEWPAFEFKVHVFGSSGNLLSTSESDVDICIQTSLKNLETMHMLAAVLANNGMERVVCVAAAKVPIVKLWDPELQLAADLNVNNTLALENTRMIKTYVMIDERVRPLAMTVKQWTKQRILNDAGTGGTLSSYAWICLILNFLQTRQPPILPALHQMPHEPYVANDGTESGFSDDLDSVKGFGSPNKETIGELLFHFFRRYAYEFDYERSVVSVRHGRLLSRTEKKWDHTSKEGQWRLCIEEPFNSTRNLGNSVDSTAFRGIHLELRRAFDLLADGGQLDKCCEQYQFPPEEKIHFKKPTPGPKAVLSAPGNNSLRNSRQNSGGTTRGNRAHAAGKNSSAAYRRSSSGASFGRMPTLPGTIPYLPGQMMPHTPEMVYDQYLYMNQPHDALREYMFFRHAAAAQARSVIGAHNPQPQNPSSSRDHTSTSSPQKMPFLGNSPQPENNPAMTGYDGSRTNPSSPSMSNSVPVRRGLQRASVSGGSQTSTVRSQSQPARGLPNISGYPISPVAFNVAGRPVLANLVPQELGQPQRPDLPLRYTTGFPLGPVTSDAPKEYVGYYMNQSVPTQPQQSQFQSFAVPPIPSYTEIANRRNRAAEELQPLNINGSRVSRSPSPLGHGHARTYSTPLRSAPLPAPVDSLYGRNDSVIPLEYPRQPGGLLIVNGSGAGYPLSLPSDVEYPVSEAGTQLDAPFEGPELGDLPVDIPHQAFIETEPHELDDERPMNTDHARETHDRQPNGLPNIFEAEGPDISGAVDDSRTLPFPPLVAPVVPIPAPHRQEPDSPISPHSAAPTYVSIAAATKPNRPSLDTTTATVQDAKTSEPKTAPARTGPVLSPVIETKTPSPTAQRRSEFGLKTSLNGITSTSDGQAERGFKSNGKASTSRQPKPVPPTPAPSEKQDLESGWTKDTPTGESSPAAAAGAAQPKPNPWETKINKKKKPKLNTKRKVDNKQQKAPNELGGQAMPLDEAERKGG